MDHARITTVDQCDDDNGIDYDLANDSDDDNASLVGSRRPAKKLKWVRRTIGRNMHLDSRQRGAFKEDVDTAAQKENLSH